MDSVLSDNEEDLLSTVWDPHEWISKGKTYHDVPPVVQVERRNLLNIPASFTKNLPSKTMSISQLLRHDLPPCSDSVDSMDIDLEFFTDASPIKDVEDVLLFLALPTRTMLESMVQAFGQAWFDGRKSIHTWLNPELALPFWTLTYWGKMLDACESRDAWLRADVWLNRSDRTAEETTMKLTIRSLWNVLPWHGNLPAFGNIQVVGLAALFSKAYLGSEIVDALITLLSLRLRLSEDTMSKGTLIVDTTFANVLRLLLPIVDGVATGPIQSSSQRYLEKYGVWFQDKQHRYLYLILYRPPKHWTACCLDFAAHTIRYGDSLGWKRPKEFFDALESWLNTHKNTDFTVTDDLPCGEQTDGYNCPIIAVNAIAHNAFGDPLWTPENANAMRMKAFRDIVKYALSAKNTHITPRILNSNDCAENILAANPDFNDALLLADRNGLADGGTISANREEMMWPEGDAIPEVSMSDEIVRDSSGDVKRTAPEMTDDMEVPRKKARTAEPGLTAAYDEKVGNYLDRTGSNGGGAHAVGYYSDKLFKKEFANLSEQQKQVVYAAQQHDHTWRNDVTPGILASFATGTIACLKTVYIAAPGIASPSPCSSCLLLFTSKSYQNTIKKPAPDAKNLRYVPVRNQNPHAGMIYARCKGLEALVSEDNEYSLERRYFQHVINGDFKDDTIFNGIIQAKVLAKALEAPLAKTLPLTKAWEILRPPPKALWAVTESARGLTEKLPSIFPCGVNARLSKKHQMLRDYKYPSGAPLSLSVDDTKLHAALRPLYNGALGKWFIVGTTGEPMEVPNAEAINKTLDDLEQTAEIATKLRLWVLQIPLPGVPPLILAIMAIGSKVKGAQLAEWQLSLMKGLISRGFRISSSGGEGAAVERECHRIATAASKVVEHRIKHPDPDYPDIIVTVWDLDGNVWVDIQDAKHG
ncbi:hypothetical protein C8R44DRAFT_873680 [Mycena epipterygia]|nr:hypothetical protein C8R44DRAFT_873680 [Mycena epipterygia]